MPLAIEVRDGETISIKSADGVPVTESDPNFQFFSRYSSIDRLFSELHGELGQSDEVKVRYHASQGFPIDVELDRRKSGADDELYLTVTKFEAR